MKTPWINYSEMKGISSKQKVFIICKSQIKPPKRQEYTSELNSTCEMLNSPDSDFVNDLLDIEKEDKSSLVEGANLAAHLDSTRELLIASENKIEDEVNNLLEKEEAEGTNPVEEQDLAAHLDSTRELLIASENKIEDGMNDLLKTEEVAETNPVEEQDLAAHLDSNRELLIASEIKIEDGMNDLLKTEEVGETNPVEEQELATHLDSNRELLFPSEIKIEDEMNNLLETEETEGTNSVEEQGLAAHLDSDYELLIASEVKIEDEMNNLLETEETEGTNPMEEQDFAAQPDSNREIISFSETAGEDKIMSLTDTEDMEKTNPAGHVSAFPDSIQGKVCSLTKKILISTHVEIDDFLHAPICGEIAKNTFEFFDQNNLLSPQFETKLINTTMDYPEQPNCRLVRSKINECIFLMKNDTFDNNNQKNNPFKSVAVPLHNTQSIKKGETNNHSCTSDDFMNIRVPVVVGEYKIEICLEEYFVFDNGIAGVKDISNEIVLTNSRFVPNQFSQSLGNGTCTALKGNLIIEGFINQNIEYTALHTMSEVLAENESLLHSNQLCQNIVLELVIHMLQVQQIRVLRV